MASALAKGAREPTTVISSPRWATFPTGAHREMWISHQRAAAQSIVGRALIHSVIRWPQRPTCSVADALQIAGIAANEFCFHPNSPRQCQLLIMFCRT